MKLASTERDAFDGTTKYCSLSSAPAGPNDRFEVLRPARQIALDNAGKAARIVE